jgi:ketosteroid isomerase-like protein
MLRKLLVVLGLAVLAAVPLQAQDSATVAKSINDLELQWGASISAGNWDAVASFLAPGYTMTGGDGKRIDAAGYVGAMRDSGDKYSTMVAGPYTVLVSGNTAVHFGEANFSVTTKKGKVTRIHEVWTDTWIRQANGQWLCVATQMIDHVLK